MEVKSFDTFVKESIGAITMERKPNDKLNSPTNNVVQPRTIPMGGASSIPMQWKGGPGSQQGSRYGNNPTLKKRALTYNEFMTASKKQTNESEEFNWDDILGNMSASDDKWAELERDMMELADKYAGDFGVDSYGVADAMHQVLDGMFQRNDRK